LRPFSSAICADTDDRALSITFDDGPAPGTEPLLDVLAERDVKSTFFMISSAARRYPGIVHRAIAEGHEIALHGGDHSRTTSWPLRLERGRLLRAKEELEDVAGQPVRWYRPSYGALRPTLVRHARALGMDTMIWSMWAQDWDETDPRMASERAFGTRHPGGVLLLHDHVADRPDGHRAPEFAAKMSAPLIDRLQAEGWELIPAGDLLTRYRQIRCAWFTLGDRK
jgi:peptidoglycan/xylan/chitin deacetylase (PgdA/CDA1 family)